MKVSKKFLSDYIDIENIDYKEIADKMVFCGNEYESITKLSDCEGLVVGYVKECSMHPNSDHLHVCQVDLGDGVKQIICGAPNVDKGQKVIVAKVGARLGDIVIKKATLAGLESNGMICSLLELGIESKYLTEEDKTGIHVLGEDAIVGEDALKYLELDDEVIDFELTADRADLLSIIGVAYEVGAIYNKKVKLPIIKIKENNEQINVNLDVKTNKCSMYLGRKVVNVKISESPKFIQNRLIASGIRPINNVVDISNYVMLEYGQPLHFFDADKLGNNVIVRNANDNELFTTLDGIERKLSSEDIVIANNEVVALAGVMGGLDTEVTSDTKNIFIESAIFDSVTVRNTSKRVLRSESSNRFEKGIDPNRTELALNRAAQLLTMYAGGEVCKGIVKYDLENHSDKIIDLTLEDINRILGTNLSTSEVNDILKRLEFKFEIKGSKYKCSIPTRRIDVNIKEDLVAEIGKIYGYNNIKSKLPESSIKKGTIIKSKLFEKDIRKVLNSLGLNQVITYSLVGDTENSLFKVSDKEDITLLDPLSEDKKTLRKSLIPSLINVYNYNISRNIKDINIFENECVYYKDEDKYIEEKMVGGLLSGNLINNKWSNNNLKVDFYLVKGIVEYLLNYLGLSNRFDFKVDKELKGMHPGRSASILLDREVIGYLGQVHPSICKKEVYVFSISVDKLMKKNVRLIKAKEISKYPSVNKDLAFVVNKNVTCNDVTQILKKVGGRLLNNIEVFDVYVGENVSQDEKSLAFSLTFIDPNKTLSDEEVTTIFNKMIEEVENKLDAKLRDKNYS